MAESPTPRRPSWLARCAAWRLLRRPRYVVDVSELAPLLALAERLGRRPDDLARELLARAVEQVEQQEANRRCWDALSPRQKQVAALICLDFTTPEIAARLEISAHTVDSHADQILRKFNAANRQELRKRLAGVLPPGA